MKVHESAEPCQPPSALRAVLFVMRLLALLPVSPHHLLTAFPSLLTGCILFSTEDFLEPGNIRKALQRKDGKFQSVLDPPRPLPGCCEMMCCEYRIITNWASFFSQLEFEGCTQTLHVPYMAPRSLPTDICVIFRPTAFTYGVFIVTRKLSDEALTGEDSLLGEQILP